MLALPIFGFRTRVGPAALPPVRFALTFDDGPSGREHDNPTASILDTLADNPTQPGIKAIFFVQPRTSRNASATPRGRTLLAREHADGHVLGLHDGSTRAHPNHRRLDDAALEQTLRDGLADLAAFGGHRAALIRPPFWAFDARTVAAYERHGLAMVLTDISANDGKTTGFRASPRRRMHMARSLVGVRKRMQRGEIPLVDGVAPIIIAFHDTNDYTAAHMAEYLEILVDKAHAAGLSVCAKPFFDNAAALQAAALVRARDVAHRIDMVPWLWRWIEW
jgi:peptidoglycan/xylan/chitin deacetylase (PgdA/CDA1 family)